MNMLPNTISLIGPEENDHYEEARKKGEVVHSGHFMISSVADQEEIEESDPDRDSPIHYEQNRMRQLGYDFSNVSKETRNTYQFGPLPTNKITIDGSLARLFQCMSLAYQGGKVVSPKWKNFKGMKLTVKDKIRLNNAIWRTWHIQYIMRKRKVQSFIQFATPMEIDYNWHAKPEAVVMEGKYWKMRIDSVVAEYKKWRGFFMEKLKLSDYPGLMWVSENVNTSSSSRAIDFQKPKSSDDTQLDDFSDTLFNNLSQQPFEFPNAREIAMQMTNSDMIQPGLLQLQPIVDDFLDFDSIHDLLNPPKKNVVPFSGAPSPNFLPSSTDVFETSSFANMLEAGAAQQQNNVPNNQPMDFNNDFQQIPTKNAQLQPRQQFALSSDPTFSVINIVPAPSYPQNSFQQSTTGQMPGEALNNVNPSILPNYEVDPTKSYPVEQDSLQQQMLPKPNPPVNTGFEMRSNAANVRRPYSQLKTSQEMQYFPPHQSCDVATQQNPSINPMVVNHTQKRSHHTQAGNLFRSGVETASLNNLATNHVTAVMQPPQPQQKRLSEINMPVVRSDVAQLKQLLTSKSYASPQLRNNGRNSNQRIPAQPSQQPPSWPGIEQSQKTVINSAQGPSRNQQAFEQTASGCHMDTTPSGQSFVETMDMEQGSHEPVLSMPQDQDMAQTEAQQKPDSLSTEQRRRFNIKMEFSRLQKTLYGDSFQSHTKTSKAALMSKAAQQIQKLKMEKVKRDREISSLKEDLEKLKLSISSSQRQLPATGAPVPRHRTEEAKNQFETWARERTKQDWKFYIFGVVIRPWFDSYLSHVSSVDMARFNQSVREWLDTGCSLPVLRRGVVQSLQVLSTTTCILNNASQLQKQVEDSFKNQP